MGLGILGHWGIENRLHRLPDMPFQADQGRLGNGTVAEPDDRQRRIALNLLRCEQAVKASIRGNGKFVGRDHAILIKFITG